MSWALVTRMIWLGAWSYFAFRLTEFIWKSFGFFFRFQFRKETISFVSVVNLLLHSPCSHMFYTLGDLNNITIPNIQPYLPLIYTLVEKTNIYSTQQTSNNQKIKSIIMWFLWLINQWDKKSFSIIPFSWPMSIKFIIRTRKKKTCCNAMSKPNGSFFCCFQDLRSAFQVFYFVLLNMYINLWHLLLVKRKHSNKCLSRQIL